ncbi:5'-nucleotidase C-terminal domain-containing protein [candidate division TA06 bacterium]|uniref:5'-nucleotidase C-terminal domain-containing protein n=1 Tax=candidate division TA06 bacterium TaxID=2250710 RepID=A0A933I762_UNCT6|nr:5'-nucleotidase C-terminal domain-containing protein [candidate division TA06 bacterium]
MNKNIFFRRLALILAIGTLVKSPAPAQPKPAPQLLDLYSIGFPAWDYQPAAWNINVLKIFDNKLYLGYGDATINTGPTDVIYYDLESKKFVKEFTVDDEGIYQYQVIDGKLVIPGVDATEEWDFGNIYVLDKSGWVKHRSITKGIHVFDAVSYKNKWYVGTGNYSEFTKEETFAFGAILGSADSCKTWKYEYITPCDKNGVYRISALISYKDKLYAFPYAYVGYSLEEVPAEYRQYLGKPYVEDGKEYYLVSIDNAFGNTDAVCYNGSLWQPADLVPDPQAYHTRPVVFRDKLILSVISGKYISSVSDYIEQKGKLPDNVKTSLYVFDGLKTEKLTFAYELIRDILPKQDKLYILYFNKGQNLIAETTDLKTWKYYLLPASVKKPLSIETDGNVFYVGAADGNVFRAALNAQVTSGTAAGRLPVKFYGAAETAKEAQRYWAAVTGWKTLGRAAKYSCEIKTDNAIEIKTDNLSGLIVYLPLDLVDKSKLLTLEIDGQQIFKDKSSGFSSFDLSLKNGKWRAAKGNKTPGSFKTKDIVVGRAGSDLSRKGDDPETGNWQADVIKWAGKTDIALVTRGSVRKDIRKGDITAADVYNQNYRNTICIFKAKGADIRRMLEYNIKQPARGDKIQVSGFDFAYNAAKDPQKNVITALRLAPDKEYSVATSNYIVQEAKNIVGDEIKAEDTYQSVIEATIKWLQENKKIGAISPRIKINKLD